MRILALGDVVGRSGRDAVVAAVPRLRQDLALDFVVVCAENAAHGFGLTAKIASDLFEAGVDVVTLGNHSWDQREMIAHIDREPRILRPMNYPSGTPGRGAGIFQAPQGKKVLVMQVMGRLFMDPLDDPFAAVAQELNKYRLGKGGVDAIVIDVHAEATSEKMSMAHFADGRASLVFGTHSHIPTADAQILPGGTACQTDLGMCGDYNSVIGMRKEAAIARFTRKMPTDRLAPADGEATVCGCVVETDDLTGLVRKIQPVRLGGRLLQGMPEF
ncbi:TIGR00282 family metallophosphoesterase [Insolitispirillum peregrinum]|uniref:TIGR00282 family metallophosphoesterase n=1 Tax=Insolitispirillum peregrinum TaxID=80876 RepID=UPI003618D561